MPEIQLHIENLYKISEKHALTLAEINEYNTKLPKLLEKIHSRKQGFYEILDDKKSIEKFKNFAEKNKGKFKHIVILGIGGSALGASCLKKSLKYPQNDYPKLHIVDNIDPDLIQAVDSEIDYTKTLFLVITKSGTTAETLSQYYYFKAQCKAKKLSIQKHFTFITDPEKGELRKIANTENITTFDIPENIGGRFSIFTAVGLIPAALIGINIEQLIAGAKQMRDNFLNTKAPENLAFKLATIQYLLSKKEKNINVIMPYSQKLTKLSDWYSQLLAESTGKKLNNQNEEVYTGITPIKALGVTDQHSQIQLYNEGPNNKLIIFIETENYTNIVKISAPYKITFNTLIKTEKQGTEQALTKNNRPNITIKLQKINEKNIGELLMLFQASTAFLGEFLNINTFNQPGVELSKTITKKLLTNHK